MNVYPSIAALLAREQLAGRLHIQPSIVCTSSELRTPEMTELIRAAWGVEPFNCLGLTETGITAVDCVERRGMHVFEDLCVYEVVDRSGKPVPAGEPGARVLVTNLFNYTQPLIRFEVTDLVTLDDAGCPCGRPSRRIVALDGRSDDMLELPTATGGTTEVHPLGLRGPMAALASVSQYQIIQHRDRLEIAVVLQAGAAATDARRAVQDALGARLAELGVVAPIDVEVRDHLPREGAGKLKLVKRA
jgi:phenylacetate-CoA ligase